MKPGYTIPSSSSSKTAGGEGGGAEEGLSKSVVISRTVEIQSISGETEGSLRMAIPVMHKHLAIVCLVLNVISPGLGE